MAGKAGSKRGLSAAALKHFLDHPGQYVRVEDLAHELDSTELQASAAVNYLILNDRLPGLTSVTNGHVWRFEPVGNDMTKWELVRLTEAASGPQALLEDTEGSLWIAKKVGF